MKKSFFVLTAVLLAVMLAGCDNTGTPEASNIVGYTEDGRAIVSLEIGISGLGDNARALNSTLAQAGTDFYEVVFVDYGSDAAGTNGARTGKTYRTSWKEGGVARINIPTGVNYNNTTKTGAFPADNDLGSAYIFAGRGSDKTLLGVGKINSVTNVTAGTSTTITSPTTGYATIIPDTTSVTFTIEPLETDITDSSTPSFYGATASDVVRAAANTVTINDVDAPVFMLSGSTPTTAKFRLGGTLTSGSAIKVHSSLNATGNYPGVRSLAFLDEGDIQPTDLVEADLDIITTGTPAAGQIKAGETLTFPLTVTITPDVTGLPTGASIVGLAKIMFEIPVYLFDNTQAMSPVGNPVDAVTWYFRGGLKNTLVDMGPGKLSQNGAILLGFGDIGASAGSKEIIIRWP